MAPKQNLNPDAPTYRLHSHDLQIRSTLFFHLRGLPAGLPFLLSYRSGSLAQRGVSQLRLNGD